MQRIRELAGLENAAMLTPIKPAVSSVVLAQDVVESMRKSFGKSAQYVDEPEPVHVFGVRTTRAPAIQKVLPIPPFPRKGSSSSISSDTSSLSVGPVLKRERSIAASTSGAEYRFFIANINKTYCVYICSTYLWSARATRGLLVMCVDQRHVYVCM